MNNQDYWRGRFSQLEQELSNSSKINYIQIAKIFKATFEDIEKQIENWYNRIAINNKLTLAEAKKLLTKKELEDFKWDIEEYIKKGEENSINQIWIKELENASSQYHINRLEALKLRIRQAFETCYNFELQKVTQIAKTSYSEGYYKSMYELQQGLAINFNVGKIDDNRLIRTISKAWTSDGSNFSDRIWSQKEKMVDSLYNELTRSCLTGETPDKAIKNMKIHVNKNINNSKYCASRIVLTEQAFFASSGQEKCFNELKVEKYEIIATLDLKTSKKCQSLDKKKYNMNDYRVGTTAPPFHPNCRTTTCPVVDNEFTIEATRIARDKNGKNIKVDKNMSYKEWKKKYIQ